MDDKDKRIFNTGYFGEFGGLYVPETLVFALNEMQEAFLHFIRSKDVIDTIKQYLQNYVGRPSPLYFAENLTKHFSGPKIYLKREDLNHTGSHKINNVIGQCLLAKYLNKKRIIAETGAGQHGVAVATVASMMGLDAVIYMGEVDIQRQKQNVFKMGMLGAKVISVTSGSATLKDAINEALRDWVANVQDTFYLIGSVLGPHPYPFIVRYFQSIIGEEAKAQFQALNGENSFPTALVACVGGGSNAIGLFHSFFSDPVQFYGVEAGGHGLKTDQHAATISKGKLGILHGMMSYILADDDGQIQHTHSISAGMDYPGVGCEHAFYHQSGRATYTSVKDQEVLDAFYLLTRKEGIIAALESCHAVAYLEKLCAKMSHCDSIIVNISGRGDKDIDQIQSMLHE